MTIIEDENKLSGNELAFAIAHLLDAYHNNQKNIAGAILTATLKKTTAPDVLEALLKQSRECETNPDSLPD